MSTNRRRVPKFNVGSREVVTVSALMVVFWATACNPSARRRVMHFFFEIPEPTDVETDGTQAPPGDSEEPIPVVAKVDEREITYHFPYRNGECKYCHEVDQGMNYRVLDGQNCRECHEDPFDDEFYEYTHMRDLADQCRTCHNPHKSPNPALLRLPQPEMCWECHDEDDVMEVEAHQDVQGRSCTSCHEPHHSDLEPMLREDAD